MKVYVLGGSVAGLHVAKYILASNFDVDVELYERKKAFGENIVCAGGIASYMVKKLKLEIPNEFIAMKIQKIKFYGPSFNHAELKLEREYGLILWRDKWEEWMGEQIRQLGCKIHLGSKTSNIDFKDADVIVGADGLLGVSRRLFGKRMPEKHDVHIAIQTVAKSKWLDEEAISMFFGSQTAPLGYAWSFPIGGGLFRVGLGVPLTHANQLLDYYRRLLSSVEAEPVEKPKSKLIPTAYPDKQLTCGKIALVGDAGLMTDPSTGGGIAPAIIGAKCLAEALSRGSLKLYDKLWRAELYRRNKQRYGLKQILCELSDGDFQVLVDVLKDFKPVSESIGMALIHLLVELAFRNPRFLTRHKVLRRLMKV
ncbi:MAG: NAD(P)/FAD-dependent oxidoreductase [Candidatus Jordarchaeales archaeon]